MKKSLALILLLCTVCSAALPYTVHSAPDEGASTTAPVTSESPQTEEPPLTEEPPMTEELTPEEFLHSALYQTVYAADEEFVYEAPDPLESGIVEEVCTAILSDYPEFFHLDRIAVESTEGTLPEDGTPVYTYRFVFTYLFAKGQELDDARAFVREKTDAILAKIPENADTFQILLFLHDYICTSFSYDTALEHRDIYCFLEDGKGNCQAYANLYAYLLNRLDIENAFVISHEMNHMWNQVKLGDFWYHVDLCWDDPTVDQAGRALHTNFLCSDAGITATHHYGFTAPNPCESSLYEDSFLPDLGGALIRIGRYSYGLSRSSRSIMQINWETMTATPIVDLSALRWAVWNTPGTLWKEQYLNLATDGWYLYFNGPSSLWRYDPDLHHVDLLYEFDSSTGYLYSLSGTGHTLTCTVSRAPGAYESIFTYETEHLYLSEGGSFCSVESCVVCEQAGGVITPPEESQITAGLSTRPSGEGLHDLRLLLFIDSAYLATNPTLQVKISLYAGMEERFVIGTLSPEAREGVLGYESFYADGLVCTVTDGYEIDGMILTGLENGSYDGIVVTVLQDEQIIYGASLAAASLFAPPAEDPDEPVDPDFSVDPDEPVDPNSSADPDEPVDPNSPADPDEPVDPEASPEGEEAIVPICISL